MIDRHGRLVMSNKAMNHLLHNDGHELAESYLSEHMPEFWHLFEEDFALADMGEAIPRREMIWHDRCYDAQSIAVTDASSNVVGLSITWVDITARRQAEQKLAGANLVLQRHAQHDHLTGLFNRRYMDECLLTEVTRSYHGHFPLSICLVDIDFLNSITTARDIRRAMNACKSWRRRWLLPWFTRMPMSAAMVGKSFW
jgi:hypothetical protein